MFNRNFKTWLNCLKVFILLLLTSGESMANATEPLKALPPLAWHNDVTTAKHNVRWFNNAIKTASFIMVVLPNINTYRNTGGLGRIATSVTGYSGLVMGAVSISGGAQLSTVYELNSINDALALGINPAYDLANTVLVYHHIAEFFRMAPSARLYIYLVSQATTLTTMATITTGSAWTLLNSSLAAGQIRQIGLCLNPASGYTPTITAQMNTDVIALASSVYSGAVVKAQVVAAAMEGKHMPVQFFIEARNFGGTTSSLIDATGSMSNSVQLVMLADNSVSIAQTEYAGYAAVGTTLGLRAALQIQQKLSYVAVGNLQNSAFTVAASGTGAFVNPGLSSGALLSTYTVGYTVNGIHTTGDDDVILTKGFMSVRTIPMYPGVFITDDITATVTTDDYYFGPYSLVLNEANRLMYITMIPNLNEDVNVNPTTGFIDINVITNWQAQLNLAGQQNLAYAVSTSSGKAAISYLIDPNQNVLSNSTINIQIVIVPKAFAGTINEYIGLSNPYQTA